IQLAKMTKLGQETRFLHKSYFCRVAHDTFMSGLMLILIVGFYWLDSKEDTNFIKNRFSESIKTFKLRLKERIVSLGLIGMASK
ncbi:MAG: hypothetical protein ACRCT1_00210, partial [Microcoleaceae cyanobacterium]